MTDWYDEVTKQKMEKRQDPIDMTPSSECVAITHEFEGFRSEPYRDSAGVLTWGFGETEDVDPNGSISFEEASERFLWRLQDDYASAINRGVEVDLFQYEYDALACFIYNVGVGAFNSSTLLKKLNRHDYDGAADEFLKWNKATVNGTLTVLNGLTRRRKAERAMFLGEDWRKFT